MGRSKLDKFKDNDQRINVIQPGKPIFEHIKGNWHKDYFKNENSKAIESKINSIIYPYNE